MLTCIFLKFTSACGYPAMIVPQICTWYSDVKNTCGIHTPAGTGAQGTCLVHTTLTAEMHIHLRKHARATLQQPLRHANHCDPSCILSSAQEIARIHASSWRSRSCVATQASSDHPPGCKPHPLCLWFALALGRRGNHPPQKSISTIFAGFIKSSQIFYVCKMAHPYVTRMMMKIAIITFNSSLVALLEGLCSSNPCEFGFSFFRRNGTDDLGINSPSLWPTELHLRVRLIDITHSYMWHDSFIRVTWLVNKCGTL